jgi:hypothetical protein
VVLVARSQVVENILKQNETPFEFREKFQVSKIRRDPHDESQVRQADASAPRGEVQQYAAQLGVGADFPAVLIRKQDRLLFDGNTRYEAHILAKVPLIDIYEVDVQSPRVMKRLSIAINQTQGKRCSKQDIMNYLDSLNGSVVDPEQFIRDTGWSKTSLLKYQGLREASHRLEDAGEIPRRKVNDAVILHTNSVRQVHPFIRFYRLAEDANLKAADAKLIARAVREASSEDAMLSILDQEREQRKPQIEEVRAGFAPGQTVTGMLRLHCGWIVKQGPAKLDDLNLATREESRNWLERAHRTLTSALARYEDPGTE